MSNIVPMIVNCSVAITVVLLRRIVCFAVQENMTQAIRERSGVLARERGSPRLDQHDFQVGVTKLTLAATLKVPPHWCPAGDDGTQIAGWQSYQADWFRDAQCLASASPLGLL